MGVGARGRAHLDPPHAGRTLAGRRADLGAGAARLRATLRGARLGRRARAASDAGGADPGAPGAHLRDRPRQPDADQRGVDSAGGCARGAAGPSAGGAGTAVREAAAVRRSRRPPGSRTPSCWMWEQNRSTSMSSAASWAEAEQGAKRRAFESARPRSWLWSSGEAMPVLPGPSTRLTAGAAACRPHAGPTAVRPNPAGRDPG
jgi:hypothetical protein